MDWKNKVNMIVNKSRCDLFSRNVDNMEKIFNLLQVSINKLISFKKTSFINEQSVYLNCDFINERNY